MENLFIFEPFNTTFIITFLLFAAGSAGLTLLSRKKPSLSQNIFGIWCIAIVVLFIVFKIGLQLDEEYKILRISSNMPEVSIWTELPIHLCEINVLALPFAVLSKKNIGPLRFFIIFFGIPGALLGTLVPYPGFTGYSILLPRVFGYYCTHISIIFGGICLLALKIYKPTLKDFRYGALLLSVVYSLTFGVNVLIRAVGLSEKANYFFSYSPMGMKPLEFFYRFIPVPGLYLAIPGLILISGIYGICIAVKKLSYHCKASH